MKVKRKMVFGSKAKHTNFGLFSCSHGMYSSGGYDYYIYGIRGLFNFIVDKTRGCYS